MSQDFLFEALITFLFSIISGIICFPLAIRFGNMFGLVDKPNHRKVHHKPIPVVGGLGIALGMLVIVALSADLRNLIHQYFALFLSLILMIGIGIFDDKLSLSVKFRVIVEVLCAAAIAHFGIRVENLHGIFGLQTLPIYVQYTLTIFLILAITNAFNLMDGIDGLLGSMAIVNSIIYLFALLIVGLYGWIFFFIPIIILLIVFINYNWHPAKIFMGDAGSLMFGMLFSVLGIHLIQQSYHTHFMFSNYTFVIVSGCLMIPSADTIRVFYQRAKQGKSPFSADKTHLHHLFLKLNLSHDSATKKILLLHSLIIVFSILLVPYLGILFIVILQIIAAFSYTAFLKFVHNYFRWFRFIRKYESE
jgi:UDP-GlcNAc:undecaprenyl-phosphate/decaprenyl-phosphate GlcNAc-1-phosphate transferase